MLERNGVMYTFLEGKYMWPKSMENQASCPSSIKAKGRLIKDKETQRVQYLWVLLKMLLVEKKTDKFISI